MSDKRTREEVRAELDESYETAYYKYRVADRSPWKSKFSIGVNIIFPVVIGLIFQKSFSWMVGFIILYFAIDFIVHAFRVGRWNRNIKKFGLTGYLAANGIEYGKDDK